MAVRVKYSTLAGWLDVCRALVSLAISLYGVMDGDGAWFRT